MARTFLSGAAFVLPDRVARGETLVIEDGRFVDLTDAPVSPGPSDEWVALDGRFVVPGFVDTHVHGALGIDVLDGPGAVGRVAQVLPRWGTTTFCPTSVACPPPVLAAFLADVVAARSAAASPGARIAGAHLESNFISPTFCGAQPLDAICAAEGCAISPVEVLSVLDRHRDAVAIVTLAPELPGGLDLVRRFVDLGYLVSLGHSGATFEEARAAIHAGASRATHLFNAMRPFSHKDPGVVGAVLTHDHVHVEVIADAVHVHPAAMRLAIAAKTPRRVMAVTDGTAAAGLPTGARARLGTRAITAADVARYDDGTMAGSVLTMAQAFALLVQECHMDLVESAQMCATTPAADLGLSDRGAIAPDGEADFVVLTGRLEVVETWVGGVRVFPAPG